MNFAELKNRKHDIINIAKPRWRWIDDFGLREMGRWRGFRLREMGRWSSFERWEMEKLQLQGEGDKEMGNMTINLIFGLREMGRWRSFERWGDGEASALG